MGGGGWDLMIQGASLSISQSSISALDVFVHGASVFARSPARHKGHSQSPGMLWSFCGYLRKRVLGCRGRCPPTLTPFSVPAPARK